MLEEHIPVEMDFGRVADSADRRASRDDTRHRGAGSDQGDGREENSPLAAAERPASGRAHQALWGGFYDGQA